MSKNRISEFFRNFISNAFQNKLTEWIFISTLSISIFSIIVNEIEVPLPHLYYTINNLWVSFLNALASPINDAVRILLRIMSVRFNFDFLIIENWQNYMVVFILWVRNSIAASWDRGNYLNIPYSIFISFIIIFFSIVRFDGIRIDNKTFIVIGSAIAFVLYEFFQSLIDAIYYADRGKGKFVFLDQTYTQTLPAAFFSILLFCLVFYLNSIGSADRIYIFFLLYIFSLAIRNYLSAAIIVFKFQSKFEDQVSQYFSKYRVKVANWTIVGFLIAFNLILLGALAELI